MERGLARSAVDEMRGLASTPCVLASARPPHTHDPNHATYCSFHVAWKHSCSAKHVASMHV
jgi:hypothetical protein